MADLRIRSGVTAQMTRRRSRCGSVGAAAACLAIGIPGPVPVAHAGPEYPPEPSKVWSYLISVTTRPGYNFFNADEALRYGFGICDKISQGQPYGQLMAEVERDFDTNVDFQASFLIAEAVQELCPASIPQLRGSAVHHRPLPGTVP